MSHSAKREAPLPMAPLWHLLSTTKAPPDRYRQKTCLCSTSHHSTKASRRPSLLSCPRHRIPTLLPLVPLLSASPTSRSISSMRGTRATAMCASRVFCANSATATLWQAKSLRHRLGRTAQCRGRYCRRSLILRSLHLWQGHRVLHQRPQRRRLRPGASPRLSGRVESTWRCRLDSRPAIHLLR